ncbi:MAG: alpha/beta fold hydrolase [Bacteroidota bacterium]
MRWIWVIGVAAWLAGCAGPRETLRPASASAYPVLFVHGLGGSVSGWDEAGVFDTFRAAGYRYGGTFDGLPEGGVEFVPAGPGAGGDVFGLNVADPYASMDDWADDVEDAIDGTLAVTGAPALVVVGHSAGGVAAMEVVRRRGETSGIRQIVTVAAPLGGSRLADLATRLNELTGLRKIPGLDIPLDAPAVRDLQSTGNSDFLQRLEAGRYPSDTEYVSVIVEGDPLRVAELLDLEGVLSDSGRSRLASRFMSLLIGGRNDGVIRIEDQTPARYDAFYGPTDLRLVEVDARSATHRESESDGVGLIAALSAPGANVVDSRREGRRWSVDIETAGPLDVVLWDGTRAVHAQRTGAYERSGTGFVRYEATGVDADPEVYARPAFSADVQVLVGTAGRIPEAVFQSFDLKSEAGPIQELR